MLVDSPRDLLGNWLSHCSAKALAFSVQGSLDICSTRIPGERCIN